MRWRGHKEGESLTIWVGADRISRIQDLVFNFRQFYLIFFFFFFFGLFRVDQSLRTDLLDFSQHANR